MKKKIFVILLLVVTIPLLTGCGEKREELKFKGKKGTIVFNVKKDSGYKISTNRDDLRTTKEQAVLIGKNFKIGIEFNDDFGYFFKGDFKKVKDKRKVNTDYKEVTYSDIKGIQYYYGGYTRYEIVLPIENSKKYYLSLNVYGKKEDEKSSKKAINSEEVQDVLNHIISIKVSK